MSRKLFGALLALVLATHDPLPAFSQAKSFSESVTTFYSGGEKISLECFEPVTRGPSDRRPIVMILYGGGGTTSMYRRLARRLAAEGYAAYIPDYFARTGRVTSSGGLPLIEQVAAWKETVLDALAEAARRPAGDGERVAYAGFSFGASMAVMAAEGDGRVKALALYSPQVAVELSERPVPPALIFHSTDDASIPVDVAYGLKRIFREAGVPCFLKVYPHAAHGILHPSRSVAAQDAVKRTLEFFSRQLG